MEAKQINFTIVPDEKSDRPRLYANFCAVAHTPFDFTLTFCDVAPLTQKDVEKAEGTGIVEAPVQAKIILPVNTIPGLITALQEHMRNFSENYGPKEPVH